MTKNEAIIKLTNYILAEISKSSYLSTPDQFDINNTEYYEGRLSAFNDIISILIEE